MSCRNTEQRIARTLCRFAQLELSVLLVVMSGWDGSYFLPYLLSQSMKYSAAMREETEQAGCRHSGAKVDVGTAGAVWTCPIRGSLDSLAMRSGEAAWRMKAK
jgi:hypothetical protein